MIDFHTIPYCIIYFAFYSTPLHPPAPKDGSDEKTTSNLAYTKTMENKTTMKHQENRKEMTESQNDIYSIFDKTIKLELMILHQTTTIKNQSSGSAISLIKAKLANLVSVGLLFTILNNSSLINWENKEDKSIETLVLESVQ